jgi:anaerobic ribonucleoside-triphosphate reductase activating protein
LLRIAGIETDSIVDGEGWRYVIFFQGCNHNCLGCHNPETHDFNGGKEFSVDDILKDLKELNPSKFMDITLSGGDPFFQAKEAINLCRALKKEDYNIWTYTGFEFEEFLNFINNKTTDERINRDMIEMLGYIDVVVDGKFNRDKITLDLEYRGSSNQRLVDVQKSMALNKVVQYNLI